MNWFRALELHQRSRLCEPDVAPNRTKEVTQNKYMLNSSRGQLCQTKPRHDGGPQLLTIRKVIERSRKSCLKSDPSDQQPLINEPGKIALKPDIVHGQPMQQQMMYKPQSGMMYQQPVMY